MALFLVIRGVFHCVCYYVKLCIFFGNFLVSSANGLIFAGRQSGSH